MAFKGFASDTTAFLSDLSAHNDRSWFAANRDRYESALLGRQREFVDAVGEAFSAVDSRVRCEPAVDRSIYRINRDTRFSRDKSPYKTYADMWFWVGEDRKQSPGYFVRIAPDAIWAGGGRHFMTPADLATYRAAVVADKTGSVLADIVSGLEGDGYVLGERTIARAPRGFSADHPRADLLRFTAIHAIDEVSPVPVEFESEAFVSWCFERFLRVRPLVDWLEDVL